MNLYTTIHSPAVNVEQTEKIISAIDPKEASSEELKLALSLVDLVKMLIPHKIGKVTQTNKKPSSPYDIIRYSLL